MPYSKTSELPDTVKSLPAAAQKIWMSAFNSSNGSGKDETACIKIAWKAVENDGYSKNSSGKWVKMSADSKRHSLSMFSEIMLSNDDGTAENESGVNARIPVLRKSKFKHWLYGDLNFDDSFFTKLINNFYAGTLGFDASIDLIHKPDLGAVGWVRDLVYENDTLTLLVEMLEDGINLVKTGKFKYASISVDDEYEDAETGEKYGPVLMGAALTNRPFINRQNAVSLLSMDNTETGELESALLWNEETNDLSILEDTMTDKPETNVENPTVVQLDITELNALKEKITNLEAQAGKTKELELERDRLNSKMVELQGKYETAENEKLVNSASARIDDGKKLAPVVIDFARKMLAMGKMGPEDKTVELSNDGANMVEWMRAAVKEMLFSFPCTLPVQPNTVDASLDNPNTDDKDKEAKETLDKEVQEIWKL